MDERQFDQPDDEARGGDDLAGSPSSGAAEAATGEPSARPTAEELERLVDELTAAARVRAAVVTVETAALVDAVAALRPFEAQYGMRWRQWVAWRCGLTTAEARRICLLAEKLPNLPLLDARFRSGALSDGVVEKLARVATPANEAAVVAAAEVATGPQLEQVVRDFRTVRKGARPPKGSAANDPATMPSEASWGWDDDGRHRGSWNLRADDGAVLEAALELALARFRCTEEEIDRGGAGDVDEARSTPDPEAAGDGATDPEGAGPRHAPGDPPAARTRGEEGIAEGELRPDEKPVTRRPDALVAFANMILAAHADDGLLPESVQIILHHNLTPTGTVDADGVLRPPVDAGPDATAAPDGAPEVDPLHSLSGAVLPGCGAIPDWLAQKLVCDALVITVAMIGGFPVSEPTAERSFNRAQRRAQRARDRHCRFPGCARTRHLHAHHTRRWCVSRRTSVADSVLLCEQHHTLVHRRGFTIALGVDHAVTVTRPDGTTLRGTPMPPPDLTARGSGPRPDDPPPDRRRTGTREPLTHYARDILATSWHLADTGPPGPEP